MKVLVVVFAVLFLFFILIVGSLIYKIFQMVLVQMETSNAKRIEMSKKRERMKREFEDRWHNSRWERINISENVKAGLKRTTRLVWTHTNDIRQAYRVDNKWLIKHHVSKQLSGYYNWVEIRDQYLNVIWIRWKFTKKTQKRHKKIMYKIYWKM